MWLTQKMDLMSICAFRCLIWLRNSSVQKVRTCLPAPAPYTYNLIEDGVLMHYLDQTALHKDPTGLARIAENGFVLSVDGHRQTPEIVSIRLHPLGQEPGFATLIEARAALAPRDVFPTSEGDLCWRGDG